MQTFFSHARNFLRQPQQQKYLRSYANTDLAYVFLNICVPTRLFYQELNSQKNIHIAVRKSSK